MGYQNHESPIIRTEGVAPSDSAPCTPQYTFDIGFSIQCRWTQRSATGSAQAAPTQAGGFFLRLALARAASSANGFESFLAAAAHAGRGGALTSGKNIRRRLFL